VSFFSFQLRKKTAQITFYVDNKSLLPWYGIAETHGKVAAQNNPFRMIGAIGGLEDYMKVGLPRFSGRASLP
jgi:hypothetical protein